MMMSELECSLRPDSVDEALSVVVDMLSNSPLSVAGRQLAAPLYNMGKHRHSVHPAVGQTKQTLKTLVMI